MVSIYPKRLEKSYIAIRVLFVWWLSDGLLILIYKGTKLEHDNFKLFYSLDEKSRAVIDFPTFSHLN